MSSLNSFSFLFVESEWNSSHQSQQRGMFPNQVLLHSYVSTMKYLYQTLCTYRIQTDFSYFSRHLDIHICISFYNIDKIYLIYTVLNLLRGHVISKTHATLVAERDGGR